jgi:hypothetical protein
MNWLCEQIIITPRVAFVTANFLKELHALLDSLYYSYSKDALWVLQDKIFHDAYIIYTSVSQSWSCDTPGVVKFLPGAGKKWTDNKDPKLIIFLKGDIILRTYNIVEEILHTYN